MAQNNFFDEERLEFVRNVRENLKNEPYIDSCLWKTSPSKMIIKIVYKKEDDDENGKKVETFLKNLTTTSFFFKLGEIGFSPIFIKKQKTSTKIHYVFEKKVVDEHPHRTVTPFMSWGGAVTYGHDEAGRTWVAYFGQPYTLFKQDHDCPSNQ